MSDTEEKLNSDWINDFEENDKLYKYFYKTKINKINIYFVYVNNSKEIIYVNKSIYNLEKINILLKEELINLIKSNREFNNNLFKIFSIKYFNIDLDEENINKFVNTENIDLTINYLNDVNYLDNINFNDTIKLFEKLNSIYLFYVSEKKNISVEHNNTKKIYLSSNNKRNKTCKIKI